MPPVSGTALSAAPADPLVSPKREYARWRHVKQWLGALQRRQCRSARDEYELQNVVERWLLSLCQVGCALFPGPASDGATEREETHAKCLAELLEKKLITTYEQPRVLEDLRALAERRNEEDPGAHEQEHEPVLRAGVLTYRDFAYRLPAGQERFLQERPSEQEPERRVTRLAALALRYETLLNRGQQWALPRRVYAHLFRRHNFRFEAFASPLNTRIGALALQEEEEEEEAQEEAQTRRWGFCSLFAEELERPYGSLGSFFDVELGACSGRAPGDWVVNPPFVEALMLRAVEKIVRHLDAELALHARGDAGASPSVTFLILLPAWRNSEAHRLARSSVYARALAELAPHSYTLEQPDGRALTAPFACTLFLLSLEPWTEGEGAQQAMDAFMKPLLELWAVAPPASNAH